MIVHKLRAVRRTTLVTMTMVQWRSSTDKPDRRAIVNLSLKSRLGCSSLVTDLASLTFVKC
jgi:hypothetical protein